MLKEIFLWLNSLSSNDEWIIIFYHPWPEIIKRNFCVSSFWFCLWNERKINRNCAFFVGATVSSLFVACLSTSRVLSFSFFIRNYDNDKMTKAANDISAAELYISPDTFQLLFFCDVCGMKKTLEEEEEK